MTIMGSILTSIGIVIEMGVVVYFIRSLPKEDELKQLSLEKSRHDSGVPNTYYYDTITKQIRYIQVPFLFGMGLQLIGVFL